MWSYPSSTIVHHDPGVLDTLKVPEIKMSMLMMLTEPQGMGR